MGIFGMEPGVIDWLYILWEAPMERSIHMGFEWQCWRRNAPQSAPSSICGNYDIDSALCRCFSSPFSTTTACEVAACVSVRVGSRSIMSIRSHLNGFRTRFIDTSTLYRAFRGFRFSVPREITLESNCSRIIQAGLGVNPRYMYPAVD